MALGSGCVGGEEETGLLTVNGNDGSNGSTKRTETGYQVRRRLAVCLFLHITGVAIVTQIYPKVVLDYFGNDDGKASKFNGWLTFASCAVQLIAIPSVSSASDAIGRRVVLQGSFALSGMAVLALGLTPNSIVAVSICQIVSGVCNATLPVSQAIIIDVSHWSESEGGGEVTHGLGLIGAAFGLAISVGPVIGGSLSEFHRRTACILCAAMSSIALLSVRFYGWKETAPRRRSEEQATDIVGRETAGCCRRRSGWRVVNPFSILKVLLESSLLVQLSLCLLCFELAVTVFSVFYNYFDFRYHWDALEISFFYSVLGILLALTSGVGIRFLVPKRLSESGGVLVGMAVQASAKTAYGLAPRGWMVYPVLLVSVVQYITEPCIQAIMTKLVGEDRQGSLQGAVMSLRILAQGIAAPVYGEVLSFGLSDAVKRALGTLVPGLPLFLSATFSLAGFMIAWFCLPPPGVALVSVAEAAAANDSLDYAEEANFITSPRRATRQGDNLGSPPSVTTASTVSSSWVSPSTSGHGEKGTMTEPLLEGAAPSSS